MKRLMTITCDATTQSESELIKNKITVCFIFRAILLKTPSKLTFLFHRYKWSCYAIPKNQYCKFWLILLDHIAYWQDDIPCEMCPHISWFIQGGELLCYRNLMFCIFHLCSVTSKWCTCRILHVLIYSFYLCPYLCPLSRELSNDEDLSTWISMNGIDL